MKIECLLKIMLYEKSGKRTGHAAARTGNSPEKIKGTAVHIIISILKLLLSKNHKLKLLYHSPIWLDNNDFASAKAFYKPRTLATLAHRKKIS